MRKPKHSANEELSIAHGVIFRALFIIGSHIIIRTQKGGIALNATGYIQVHAFASNAQLPLKDVAITVKAEDGTVIAMRLTDRSGRIDPIEIPTPDLSESQSPGQTERPFTTVNLSAQTRGYELVRIDGLQVFPSTTTDQELEMIPLSELPALWSQSESFLTPPQNL